MTTDLLLGGIEIVADILSNNFIHEKAAVKKCLEIIQN